MPKSENQKMKILYLMQMLAKETDKDHKLTVNEMIDNLDKRHHIKVERKTIYADLDDLRDFGLDIKRDKTKTFNYFIATRDFELPELKLLVDVIQSSKFITSRKSNELIKKLEGLTSNFYAKKLQREVHVNKQVKNMNESIYNNVDEIQDAIYENKKIKFQYYEYTLNKGKQLKKGGKWYYANPLFLTWDNENYYLVAFCPIENIIKHYRVDKMIHISIEDEKRDIMNFAIDPANYTNKVFGMYSGEENVVEVEFDISLIDVVIDRFGKDVVILNQKGNTFVVRTTVEISLVFIGWLFQFGLKAKVLSPKSLVDEMKVRAKELIAQYK